MHEIEGCGHTWQPTQHGIDCKKEEDDDDDACQDYFPIKQTI